MNETPRIERDVPHPEDDRPGLLVVTPFDEDFKADVKELPTADRQWRPDDYQQEGWWVAVEHLDYLLQLTKRHFGGVAVVGGPGGDEYHSAAGERAVQDSMFQSS